MTNKLPLFFSKSAFRSDTDNKAGSFSLTVLVGLLDSKSAARLATLAPRAFDFEGEPITGFVGDIVSSVIFASSSLMVATLPTSSWSVFFSVL